MSKHIKQYTLWRAFSITRKTNNHPLIAEVFANACANNRHIGYCYTLYSWLPNWVQALAVMLYGTLCVAKLRVPPISQDTIFSNPAFVNEQKTVAHFAKDFPEFPVTTATYSMKNILRPATWWGLRGGLKHLPRLFRICRLLTKRYGFLPAMRGGSTIFYGLFLQRALQQQRPAAALIVSNYSPQAMGLAFAAHSNDIPLLFRNHALPASAKGINFQPLCSDVAILTGEYARDTYVKQAYLAGDVCYRGLSNSTAIPRIKATTDNLQLGVFLTGVYDLALLEACLQRFITLLQPTVIHLRPHPLDLTRPDFSALAAKYPILDIAAGIPLIDHCAQCDMVICGNTSAMLDVLNTGTPVVYEHRLDTVYYDYIGAVENQLVLPFATLVEALKNEGLTMVINRFYQSADWPARMQYYDAGFQQDQHVLLATATKAIKLCLGRQNAP